jgi:hypothetical protein
VGLPEAHSPERAEDLLRHVDGGWAQWLAVWRAVCVPEREALARVPVDDERALVDRAMMISAQNQEPLWIVTAAFGTRVSMMCVEK